jgi:hypothetical protein
MKIYFLDYGFKDIVSFKANMLRWPHRFNGVCNMICQVGIKMPQSLPHASHEALDLIPAVMEMDAAPAVLSHLFI